MATSAPSARHAAPDYYVPPRPRSKLCGFSEDEFHRCYNCLGSIYDALNGDPASCYPFVKQWATELENIIKGAPKLSEKKRERLLIRTQGIHGWNAHLARDDPQKPQYDFVKAGMESYLKSLHYYQLNKKDIDLSCCDPEKIYDVPQRGSVYWPRVLPIDSDFMIRQPSPYMERKTSARKSQKKQAGAARYPEPEEPTIKDRPTGSVDWSEKFDINEAGKISPFMSRRTLPRSSTPTYLDTAEGRATLRTTRGRQQDSGLDDVTYENAWKSGLATPGPDSGLEMQISNLSLTRDQPPPDLPMKMRRRERGQRSFDDLFDLPLSTSAVLAGAMASSPSSSSLRSSPAASPIAKVPLLGSAITDQPRQSRGFAPQVYVESTELADQRKASIGSTAAVASAGASAQASRKPSRYQEKKDSIDRAYNPVIHFQATQGIARVINQAAAQGGELNDDDEESSYMKNMRYLVEDNDPYPPPPSLDFTEEEETGCDPFKICRKKQ